MDKIQKVLIEQGRKDLAQLYYKKTCNKGIKKTASISKKAFSIKSIHGLTSVPRTFSNLLVPMAQYVLTKYIKENPPKIASNIAFDKKIGLVDVQTDVYKTEAAIQGMTAIYEDKIITSYQNYDNFIVTAYAMTREAAKQWQDEFEHKLTTQNQFRGKCLYAEAGDIIFKEIPTTNWDDVILEDKVKKDIRLNTVSFLGDVKLASTGVTKRGLVMYGPPGTGKTSVVKAVFKELEGKNVSRIYVTAESFKRMAVGNLFDMLAYLGPTVMAFEDIDLVSGSRDIHTSSSGMLGDLLTNLDGMRKNKDALVVMASTNKIEMLDGALADRPGRFDRRIKIGLPSSDNLRKMYFNLVGNEVNDELIKMSNNFTGSHVVETVNTARILAASEQRKTVDCLKDACTIIRENFFPGQTTDEIKVAALKKISKIAKKYVLCASDPVIQQVGDAIKGKSLMDLRPVLEKIFPKKDIDFTHVGASHFRIKYKGKTLMIVNKKYVDGKPELIVDELAIGYDL